MNLRKWMGGLSKGLCLVVLLPLVFVQTARADQNSPRWDVLAPEQQELLQRFEGEWE